MTPFVSVFNRKYLDFIPVFSWTYPCTSQLFKARFGCCCRSTVCPALCRCSILPPSQQTHSHVLLLSCAPTLSAHRRRAFSSLLDLGRFGCSFFLWVSSFSSSFPLSLLFLPPAPPVSPSRALLCPLFQKKHLKLFQKDPLRQPTGPFFPSKKCVCLSPRPLAHFLLLSQSASPRSRTRPHDRPSSLPRCKATSPPSLWWSLSRPTAAMSSHPPSPAQDGAPPVHSVC